MTIIVWLACGLFAGIVVSAIAWYIDWTSDESRITREYNARIDRWLEATHVHPRGRKCPTCSPRRLS